MLSEAKHLVEYRVREEIAEKVRDLILRSAQDGGGVRVQNLAFFADAFINAGLNTCGAVSPHFRAILSDRAGAF
jgi:hypothetical protein